MSEKPVARLIVRTGKTDSLQRFHPWVFSGALKRIEGQPAEGDLVALYDNHDHFLALAQYGQGSIAARVISWEEKAVDLSFWTEKFVKAWNFRIELGLLRENNNVFRLVHGEADHMPGLIADYYHGVVVFEFHSAGMERLASTLADALMQAAGSHIQSIVSRSKANPEPTAILLAGEQLETPHQVCENGLKFLINWNEGQKTGFFIDQRENRQQVREFSKGKNVLNMFSYTGGFSVYAMAGGATSVTSVDSSAKAIDLCDQHMKLNGFDTNANPAVCMDALDYLKDLKPGLFDIIILDPPAYAKRADARHHAIQGYKRLNAEALSKLPAGGLLFTYSCSQVVDRQHFTGAVTAAAISCARNVKVVAHLSQASCHAHNIFHPEGLYLKGLLLRVE